MITAFYNKYTLQFKQPAGTSRGTLYTKQTYYLYLKLGHKTGIGECNLFKGLSIDDRPDYQDRLQWLCDHIHLDATDIYAHLIEWPSIIMGYETAIRSLHSDDPFVLFKSPFTDGSYGIPINGLVWMGNHEFMLQQLEQKIAQGYSCIKIKIGAIDFDHEMGLLDVIRSRFRESEITIRVDANGAFNMENVMFKLDRLSQYNVHSIEQPIAAGQWQEMALLCEQSPVPIALDEELIGLHYEYDQQDCIDTIRPQYIILKPALVGGFAACDRWIDRASSIGVKYWITSALESNVGLNAIAQYTYTIDHNIPQGLGTGALYTNNIASKLEIKKAHLYCNNNRSWDTNALNL